MTKFAIPARTAHLLRQRLARVPTSPDADALLWPLFEWIYQQGLRETEIQRMERWMEKHSKQLEELI